ncbi:putative peritrophin-44-like [Penaeus vannamei]|uniref:Putative peritrophin-44-like n=1 Tax=Penaeus vannamei TaxID=6689 RepID=A0A3R7PKN3_PENVA|nr:putative peritrophin-44-like [Penaeus vannamei]
MWSIGIVSSLLLACASAQQLVSDCPSPNGYFADSVQCDKYYDCVDDVLTEKLCPDGMAFNDLNPRIEKCDFTFQNRPSPRGVPRQNGYFPHPDPKTCNKFYYCAAGAGSLITCPDGLVFSLKTGNCVWPDAAGRGTPTRASPTPTTASTSTCASTARTPGGTDAPSGRSSTPSPRPATRPRRFPECADYYSQYFDEYFQTLSSGGRVSADIIAAAIAAGYDVPDLKDRVRVATGGSGSGATRRRGQTPAPPLDAADDTAFRAPAPAARRPPASRPAARDEQPQRASRPS